MSRMNASGTPSRPAVAKVAITPPARTVIGAEADTPSTDSPDDPTLFLVRPCGEAGIVTVATPTKLVQRTRVRTHPRSRDRQACQLRAAYTAVGLWTGVSSADVTWCVLPTRMGASSNKAGPSVQGGELTRIDTWRVARSVST